MIAHVFAERPGAGWRLLPALLAFAALFCGGCGRHAPWHKEDALLDTPALAMEAVSGKPLYYDAPAFPYLQAKHPELLSDEDKSGDREHAAAFAQAVQEPKLFRQLDRQYRFETLVLSGSPSEYHPLLTHLLETRDFGLVYLDHTTLIFRRGSTDAWDESKLAPIRARFDTAPAADRAKFLGEAAIKLVAVHKAALGKKLAEEAVDAARKEPDGWAALSYYELDQGKWDAAVTDADHALECDDSNLEALSCKAQAYYSNKHFNDAFHVSEELLKRAPNSPGFLFQHARICHEARAFKEESKALEKLIAAANEANRPVTGYRIYLAQAYARQGLGDEALREYATVLADPDVPQDQRTELESAVSLIKSRMAETGQ